MAEFETELCSNKLSIADIIREVRVQFLKEYNIKNFEGINCGYCDLFAQEVLYQVSNLLFDLSFGDMETSNILISENSEEDCGIINVQSVKEYYKTEVPEELISVKIGYHIWVTNDEKHYDAECPEGVSNMFDLPFFQRYMKRNKY